MGTENPFSELGNIPTVAPNFVESSGGFLSGLMGGFNKLLQNNLFRQYLSAAGADLMQNTGGKNLNNAVQGNISSQNFMKVLSAMLAGNIPEGGKVVHTDTGSQFHVPAESLRSKPSALTSPDEQPAAPTAAVSPTSPNLSSLMATLGAVNPFGSSLPNFSASDLAGVSPEMISQALQLKMSREELGQRRVSDIARIMLAMNEQAMQAPHIKAQTDLAIEQAANLHPRYTLPGTNTVVNTDDYLRWLQINKENEPALIKEYDKAVAQGFKGSLIDYQNASFTADQKNYKAYVDQETAAKRTPDTFDDWLTKHERARAITTDEAVDKAVRTKLATAAVEAQVQITDPKARQSYIDNKIKTARTNIDTQMILDTGKPEEVAKTKDIIAADAIEEMIATGMGTVLSREPLKKEMRWKVRWQDGRVVTITQPRTDTEGTQRK